ncbi:MAG: MBL fold metallo-hydrolase [Acidaminococcus sp.]|jgi:L-ascorbate metabolism protein UlaG (beta-lactamase superfamily)|nr:MBL fold metallo-hydrolase [Acidaminococcus sp.]MCI2099918.1 MBL fold metallo-hydrolase [Acidaminococcus sp.]MCI2114149.1 MBL fold metallo-hydrolase [Acidaminococcus sp.]MCI2116367.1 MBL fold metallo-hydrolase [Acidaminococcus sp.]
MDEGKAVLLGNCGVYIQYEGTRFLFDGLYKDLSHSFVQLPDTVWRAMAEGRGYLSNIDYLLFSHSHFDHYFSNYLFTYMAHNQVKGLVLPVLDQTTGLKRAYEEFGGKLLHFKEGEAELGEDIRLRLIRTHHLDPRHFSLPVYAYLLALGRKKLLVMADADYQEADFRCLEGIDIDYAFVTPVFYNNAAGRRILFEQLSIRQLVLYHLPDPDNDRFQYGRMAENDVRKYGREKPTFIWREYGQSIIL